MSKIAALVVALTVALAAVATLGDVPGGAGTVILLASTAGALVFVAGRR